MKNRTKYTPAFADAERIFDLLDKEEREARKRAWLKTYRNKSQPGKEGGEQSNENPS